MDSITKAVILAAGLGTRMRKADDSATGLSKEQDAAASSGVKALIPIDRPFLDYVLHALAEAGFTKVCLVIGPDHHQLRDYYGTLATKRIRVSFAVQPKPLGTASAVAAAEEFAAGESFVMVNSDNYYPINGLAKLRQLSTPGLVAFERDAMISGSNIAADRISKFAAVEIDHASSRFIRIHEKPEQGVIDRLGTPLYLSMNCWRFSAKVFDACRAIKPSPRGEYEVTDAAQYCVDVLGEIFTAVKFEGAVLDMSSRNDIGAVAAKLKGTRVEL